MEEKVKTARLSIISNCLLIILKLVVGFLGNSVSIISEAIHSGMDLVAAIISFISVKLSDNPPDEEHPYGHGKYENVSAVIEAILIFIAAGWIIFEAIRKLAFAGHEVEKLWLGALVMFISAVVNSLVSQKIYKVAKKTDSIALEADALHLKTDVYTSLGVAGGLLIMWLADLNIFGKNTHLHIIDPLIALGVAMLVLKESYVLLKNAYAPLLDASLSEEEINIIKDVLASHSLNFHDLKTRKSGRYRFADLHLELSPNLELQIVHNTCDEIESEIKSKIKYIELNIHVEPIISK